VELFLEANKNHPFEYAVIYAVVITVICIPLVMAWQARAKPTERRWFLVTALSVSLVFVGYTVWFWSPIGPAVELRNEEPRRVDAMRKALTDYKLIGTLIEFRSRRIGIVTEILDPRPDWFRLKLSVPGRADYGLGDRAWTTFEPNWDKDMREVKNVVRSDDKDYPMYKKRYCEQYQEPRYC
jgi:hypothetical protein